MRLAYKLHDVRERASAVAPVSEWDPETVQAMLESMMKEEGGAAGFMKRYHVPHPNGVRGWRPWGPSMSVPRITKADKRCPVLLHKICSSRKESSCTKCANDLISRHKLLQTDCNVQEICKILAEAASAAHDRRVHAHKRRFVDPHFVPQGSLWSLHSGFESFNAENGS